MHPRQIQIEQNEVGPVCRLAISRGQKPIKRLFSGVDDAQLAIQSGFFECQTRKVRIPGIVFNKQYLIHWPNPGN